MSKEREIRDLYEHIFMDGTSYFALLLKGYTINEINYCLVKGGLNKLRLRHCINLLRKVKAES